MPEEIEDSCEISDLAADGAEEGLDQFDSIDTQAACVYLLASLIKAVDSDPEADFTDICALAKSLQKYDGLPDYARNAARIQAWGEMFELASVGEPDYEAMKLAIQCAHCDATPKSMHSAMTFLLCRLSTLVQPD